MSIVELVALWGLVCFVLAVISVIIGGLIALESPGGADRGDSAGATPYFMVTVALALLGTMLEVAAIVVWGFHVAGGIHFR